MATGLHRVVSGMSDRSGRTADEPRRAAPVGVLARAGGLLGQALASDDAEAGGLRADEVLAHRDSAVGLLGAPDAWPAARNAVVQRYGRVGALLVLGYEGRWRAADGDGQDNPEALEILVDDFDRLSVHDIEHLLRELERADGLDPDDEQHNARRRLHAAYAVAARDGTDASHRAYMDALDGVMRLAARRLAS